MRGMREVGLDYLVFTYTETDFLFYEALMRRAFALARDLN